MNASFLISELRKRDLIPDEARFSELLATIAMWLYDYELSDGQRLTDATDFHACLMELSREVRKGKVVGV